MNNEEFEKALAEVAERLDLDLGAAGRGEACGRGGTASAAGRLAVFATGGRSLVRTTPNSISRRTTTFRSLTDAKQTRGVWYDVGAAARQR